MITATRSPLLAISNRFALRLADVAALLLSTARSTRSFIVLEPSAEGVRYLGSGSVGESRLAPECWRGFCSRFSTYERKSVGEELDSREDGGSSEESLMFWGLSMLEILAMSERIV